MYTNKCREKIMFTRVLSIYLSLFLTLTGFIPTQVSWAQERKSYTLAVINLEAKGVSLVEADVISERLRSRVTQTLS